MLQTKQTISLSGDQWTTAIPANYQIIVTFDKSKYELDCTQLDSSLRDKVVEAPLYQYPNKPYNGPLVGGDTTKNYGYIFDLSQVSSNIIVKYVRSDHGRMEIAKHEEITLTGNTAFTINIYATIEGKCTDGYIAIFTASEVTGSGYPLLVVNDNHFSECSSEDYPGGDSPGDDDSSDGYSINDIKSFDLMFSIQSAKT